MLPEKTEDVGALILARDVLIARAKELDEAQVALSALHDAPFDRIRPSADDEQTIKARFDKISAEAIVLPVMLANLQERIARAGG